MLDTPTITQIGTTRRTVYAFELRDGLRSEDVDAMARFMESVFDRESEVSMLLLMREVGMSDALAGLTPATLKGAARSVANVGKYAVVGAPAVAAAMIEAMSPFVPVGAQAFPPEAEAEAWDFVDASAA